MNLIVGSQHHFVRMGNDTPVMADGVWSANVTVQNLTLHPMGAANFLGSEPAKYFGYAGSALGEDEILSPGEVSEAKSWAFVLNGATEFTFSVLIAAEVPDTDGYAVGLTRVSAGSRHNCAEGSDGKLYCWGHNNWGQLGDGTFTDRHLPTVVAGSGGS